ncbi:MAG: putative rane protein [Solirubrobacteraceae bacterium]|nr:putative rane protein [Solirubrobacteraceae bacterium]
MSVTAASLAAASPDASWSLSPGPLIVMVGLTLLYVRRWRATDVSVGRLLLFLSGIAVAALALFSPIDTLGEQLFLMHMVQHILLLDVAPILCILGLTRVLLRPIARPLLQLERSLGPLAHPAFAISVYVGAMWVWHIPALYDLALEHPVVHVLEHAFFTFGGALYWWHLLSPIRNRHLGGMGPVVYMLTTKLLVGALGIALTFAPEAIYAFYEDQPRYWGLSAGTDQAIGGLIMATEQSIIMGVALVALFMRALSESEREEPRRERFGEA